jgi:hypothetical protein
MTLSCLRNKYYILESESFKSLALSQGSPRIPLSSVYLTDGKKMKIITIVGMQDSIS